MSRRALVCDDDRLSALWFERLLNDWGWTVQTTLNVTDAVSAFKEAQPDVLISDLQIDDQTAQDLLKQLDIQTGPKGFPVIVVSAISQEELQSKSGLEGVATLSKPVDQEFLKATLSAFATLSRLESDGQLSCLIVDRGGIGSRSLGRMIEDFGSLPIYASELELAKMLLRNVPLDVVILDSEDPAHDAEELSAYCTSRRMSFPPMIALSPDINEGLIEQLLIAGAVDILLKPVSSNRLKEALQMIGGEAKRVSARRSNGKREVLVVEDFMITSKTYERLLTQAGYHVRVVRSAEMAYEMIRRIKPDLLLLDMNLPGMSGYELLIELKRSGQTVPTIVATGDHDPRKMEILDKLDVLKRFEKPVRAEELISYVRTFFCEDADDNSGESKFDVLLVLSEGETGVALAKRLEGKSIHVKNVNDGQQAIRLMSDCPRVVVLDFEIDGMESEGVLVKMREVAGQGQTRIFVVGGAIDNETVAKLLEDGAQEYFSKPLDVQQLGDNILALLSESRPTISATEVVDAVMPEIENAFEQSDEELFKAAARIGHNLKSTCALANMPSVAKLAAALEDAAGKHMRDSCETLLNEMRDGLNRAVAGESETVPAKL